MSNTSDSDSQAQVVATVTSNTGQSLRIITDGAESDCPADNTSGYPYGSVVLGDRVMATIQNPKRPIVTGRAQIGGA